jgi:REP element-mobilizing transposase RayT
MPENHRKSILYSRKSIRLQDYDYSQPGAYFITICTKEMRYIFGRIYEGEMVLNRYGIIAQEELLHIPTTYPVVEIHTDELAIMPNHIHAILWIMDVGATELVARKLPTGPRPQSIGAIIGQYKSRVTKKINLLRRIHKETVWQRNYYDRIIRNENELHAIKKFIIDNPLQWEEDYGKGEVSFT